jgi:hypothetical protein
LDYISKTVHTLANVKAGYGDPCMLVGFTGAEIQALTTLPIASYRLPTTIENDTFVGNSVAPTMSGSNPQIATFTSGASLPALGYRENGNIGNWGTQGIWASATPGNIYVTYYLSFAQGHLVSSWETYNVGSNYGWPVRCVAK